MARLAAATPLHSPPPHPLPFDWPPAALRLASACSTMARQVTTSMPTEAGHDVDADRDQVGIGQGFHLGLGGNSLV